MRVLQELARVAATVTACALAACALAEDYPTRPVRMIVGFPPGGATDLVARIIQPKMTEFLGQQVVVDNRPGANGIISLDLIARAQPDGYSLAFGHFGGLVISPAIQKVPYDPARSFTPIGLMVTLQNIIITHPSVNAKTLDDYIALAKAKQGQLNYASAGVGSPGHLAGELLQTMVGIKITHVPFKGGAPALTSLLAGHVPSFFAVISTAVPHVLSGRAHAIAVTGAERADALPGVPTVGESIRGYVATNWYGLLAPAGTPKAIVDRINKALVATLGSAQVTQPLNARGIDARPSSPGQYAKFIGDETRKWLPIIKRADIAP
ncbi:MAG: tripartite tricarboxylate transporter substrate binding protein [Burkholderiales bacterium]|nr:tripartite tricarboxylate transporter substrate binding protein [Burkholderiales bacterium]